MNKLINNYMVRKKQTVHNKEFKERVQKWFKEKGWIDKSDDIWDKLYEAGLDNLPYKPEYLIERDGLLFFLATSRKQNWSQAKVFTKNQTQGIGIDMYKYKMLLGVQAKTGIQVAFIFYNDFTKEWIFRQLDMLPKPKIFFGGSKCIVADFSYWQLKHDCFNCWLQHPEITRKCLHSKKYGRRRELAMWNTEIFADKITIQEKLI